MHFLRVLDFIACEKRFNLVRVLQVFLRVVAQQRQVPMGGGIRRVEAYGFSIVFERLDAFADSPKHAAAIVECAGVIRIEPDGLVVAR